MEHTPHPKLDSANHEQLVEWEQTQAEIRRIEATANLQLEELRIDSEQVIRLAQIRAGHWLAILDWGVRALISVAIIGTWLAVFALVTDEVIDNPESRENIELFIAWVGIVGGLVLWLVPKFWPGGNNGQ